MNRKRWLVLLVVLVIVPLILGCGTCSFSWDFPKIFPSDSERRAMTQAGINCLAPLGGIVIAVYIVLMLTVGVYRGVVEFQRCEGNLREKVGELIHYFFIFWSE